MSAHGSFLRFAGIYSISLVVLFGYDSYQESWGEHSFRNIFLKILEIHLDWFRINYKNVKHSKFTSVPGSVWVGSYLCLIPVVNGGYFPDCFLFAKTLSAVGFLATFVYFRFSRRDTRGWASFSVFQIAPIFFRTYDFGICKYLVRWLMNHSPIVTYVCRAFMVLFYCSGFSFGSFCLSLQLVSGGPLCYCLDLFLVGFLVCRIAGVLFLTISLLCGTSLHTVIWVIWCVLGLLVVPYSCVMIICPQMKFVAIYLSSALPRFLTSCVNAFRLSGRLTRYRNCFWAGGWYVFSVFSFCGFSMLRWLCGVMWGFGIPFGIYAP